MKYYILIAILTILIGFGIQQAYSDQPLKCLDWKDNPHTYLACYLWEIYHQSDKIIEKIDWNNCALEITSKYSYPWNRIVDTCGEIP